VRVAYRSKAEEPNSITPTIIFSVQRGNLWNARSRQIRSDAIVRTSLVRAKECVANAWLITSAKTSFQPVFFQRISKRPMTGLWNVFFPYIKKENKKVLWNKTLWMKIKKKPS